MVLFWPFFHAAVSSVSHGKRRAYNQCRNRKPKQDGKGGGNRWILFSWKKKEQNHPNEQRSGRAKRPSPSPKENGQTLIAFHSPLPRRRALIPDGIQSMLRAVSAFVQQLIGLLPQ